MYSKRPGQLERKYSIDSLKLGANKSDSPGSSREKLPVIGLLKNGRAEPLVAELQNATPALSDKINRRAEIVAAVTRRLYSHGKKHPEESKITVAIPIAETPPEVVSIEEPPPQSPVLEIPAMTKIRLQEISRKMLAKRRRIIVDTQTDFYESTTRVKDVYTLTDKIKQKDAGVLTDEHEDLQSFASGVFQVRRVKEMATLTDKLPTTVIRFQDATCVTENDNYDSNPPQGDSEMKNKQTNMDENLISDRSSLLDVSTNTGGALESPVEVQSSGEKKTRKVQEVCCKHRCICCGQLLTESLYEERKIDDKNCISITFPEDSFRITLETSNNLESKITVLENDNGSTQKDKSYHDSQTQTDFQQPKPKKPFNWVKYYDFLYERNRYPTRTYGFSAMMNSRYKMSRNLHDFDTDSVSSGERLSCNGKNGLDKMPLNLTNFSSSILKNKSQKNVSQSNPLMKSHLNFISKRDLSENKYDSLNKLLSLYDSILLLRGTKYEESFDSVFNTVTKEVKINVSKRLTETSRYNSLQKNNLYFNMMYSTNNVLLKPWYNFRK